MTRKGKAFLIGSLVPIITIWVWAFFDNWTPYKTALSLTAPAILVGGLAGMIVSVCTSGPPMSRKAKHALIGFYLPVIPGCGLVTLAYLHCVLEETESDWQGLLTAMAAMYVGGPSILLGGVIAAIVAACTRKQPGPPKCGKCGYSLVGLTGDKCPDCGHTVSTTATA